MGKRYHQGVKRQKVTEKAGYVAAILANRRTEAWVGQAISRAEAATVWVTPKRRVTATVVVRQRWSASGHPER